MKVEARTGSGLLRAGLSELTELVRVYTPSRCHQIIAETRQYRDYDEMPIELQTALTELNYLNSLQGCMDGQFITRTTEDFLISAEEHLALINLAIEYGVHVSEYFMPPIAHFISIQLWGLTTSPFEVQEGIEYLCDVIHNFHGRRDFIVELCDCEECQIDVQGAKIYTPKGLAAYRRYLNQLEQQATMIQQAFSGRKGQGMLVDLMFNPDDPRRKGKEHLN